MKSLRQGVDGGMSKWGKVVRHSLDVFNQSESEKTSQHRPPITQVSPSLLVFHSSWLIILAAIAHSHHSDFIMLWLQARTQLFHI